MNICWYCLTWYSSSFFCLSESLLWWTAMLRWDNPQRHWPGRGLFLQQGAIDLFITDSLERTGYACELKLLYFQATSLNNSRHSSISFLRSGSDCSSWFCEILTLVPSNTVPQLNGALWMDIALKYECSSGSVLLDARLLAAFQGLAFEHGEDQAGLWFR